VLHAIFESTTTPAIRAASARAIGKLGGDSDLDILEKHVGAGDSFQSAAIDGLGECRRTESANDLADLLTATTDEKTAKLIAKAAGTLGSSWAWKSLGPSAEKTGLAVREILAKALVPAFVRFTGDSRTAMSKSILMLDHPSLPDIISNERPSADTSTRRELDALSQMVASHLQHQ
jgi:hypothetical protein